MGERERERERGESTVIHNKPLNARRVHRFIEHVWRFNERLGPTRRSGRLNQPIIITGLRRNDWKSPALLCPPPFIPRTTVRGVVVCQLPRIAASIIGGNRLINGHRLMIDNATTVHRVHATVPGKNAIPVCWHSKRSCKHHRQSIRLSSRGDWRSLIHLAYLWIDAHFVLLDDGRTRVEDTVSDHFSSFFR
mgnify:CR=1 FL=1